VSFGVIRMGWKARARWWERKVRDVLDRIMTIVTDVAVVPPLDEHPIPLGKPLEDIETL